MNSIGIDVSKGKSMVCILKPYGEVVQPAVEFAHTHDEIDKLISKIKALDGETKVILEATGAYHFPLVAKFKEADIHISVINPLLMKKYASATIRKGKTDKLDAIKIANYGIDNWFKLEDFQLSDDIYGELKILGRQYSHYIKMKIQSKLSLTTLLDSTMPGIKKLLSGKRSDMPTRDKLSDFVEKYWHYDNITKLREKKFCDDYCKWAKKKGYHAKEAKAKEIYAMAKAGIPTLKSSSPSTKMLVLEAVRVLKEVNQTLSTILTRMQEIASTLPEYSTVRSMAGVGEILSVRLIAEIGDVRRFKNASSLIAFAGIDSPPFQSGQFYGTRRHISKRGSALLRKTGYEVMKSLKTVKPTEDNAVYLFILKKEAEGKPKKCAKIAGLNKFLRIYYARAKEAYTQSIFLDFELEVKPATAGLPFTEG